MRRSAPGSVWRLALMIMLVLAAGHALVVLATGINLPLLDLHSFRQTQTALSADTILHGGPWIAYQTPVLGAPWSIPFEFPIYQLLAALLAWIGVPLDAAGRLVGFGFFLMMLAPLALLFRMAGLGRVAFAVTAILYLTSPIYLYWSRTFLMESCALFFSLSWLALTLRYLAAPHRVWLLAAIGCGCAAILTKSTTFVPFAVLGGLWTVWRIWRLRSETSGRPLLRAVSAAASNLLIPFLVGLAWVRYSDHIKSANPFGQMLTADALGAWTFGSLSQRLSATLWVDTVWSRALPDVLGYFSAAALLVLGATLTSRRTLILAAIAAAGFLMPFVIFSNLHIVHNYYQNANALFLIVAVGLGLSRVFETASRALAVTLLAIIVAGQLWLFYDRFMPYQRFDYSQNPALLIAQAARDATDPKAVLIIIDGDWSSVIPYYSNRRSVMAPGWRHRDAVKPILDSLLSDPTPFLGGATLGGIVYCADQLARYGDRAPRVQAFVAGRRRLAAFGSCELLSPDR